VPDSAPGSDAAAEPPALEAVPPSQPPAKPAAKSGGNIFGRYWRHKLWALPLTFLLLVAAFMAVPTTRYMALAHFVTRPFTVTVTDSTTNTPISGASVKLGAQTALTDSSGKVTITVPVGNQKLSASKAYYRAASQTVFVDLSVRADSIALHLVATGRQVPLKVINKITGKPIPEAEFTIDQTTARSDLSGQATVVLPADGATQSAVIKADGYATLTATIQVAAQSIAANTFAMVPVGRVYFLSDQSGKIDVVSTNLDGSGRKTVLAGTGSEDTNNTVLLASRDWRYLALLSKRAGGDFPKLYLIDTGSGGVTTMDDSAANFTLVGWSNHYFIYTLQRPDVKSWQPNRQSIVSYNADTKASKTLANSKATGTSDADAEYQDIVYAVVFGSNIIYTTTWYTGQGSVTVSGQTNALVSLKVDGSGSKTLKSVDAGTSYFDSVNVAGPDQLYFAVYGGATNYYRLDANGNITQSSTITSSTVNHTYPTYLQSPSGTSTFWTSVRDGKNTLFVGDSNGNGGDQIAGASDYAPYGWFTDNYLLVQKSGSELYIMPVDGPSTTSSGSGGGAPLKISDYFKPDYAIYGYGGGYGGF
jgi:hypothetical protein